MTQATQQMARPWNRFSTDITSAKTIDEAIKMANLDWEVALKTISYRANGTTITIPGKKAIVRTDNHNSLGIVSENYQTLQNTEAFKFFEPFVENGLATLESAGSIKGGRRLFILAKLNMDDLEVEKK